MDNSKANIERQQKGIQWNRLYTAFLSLFSINSSFPLHFMIYADDGDGLSMWLRRTLVHCRGILPQNHWGVCDVWGKGEKEMKLPNEQSIGFRSVINLHNIWCYNSSKIVRFNWLTNWQIRFFFEFDKSTRIYTNSIISIMASAYAGLVCSTWEYRYDGKRPRATIMPDTDTNDLTYRENEVETLNYDKNHLVTETGWELSQPDEWRCNRTLCLSFV